MGRRPRSLWTRALALCAVGCCILLAGTGARFAAGAAGTVHLTVGGKLDTEAQLLTAMYTLLLRHAGFNVTEKAKLGTNEIVFNAIRSGQIDLYPEFTATGLARLGLKSTHNDQKDYALVKAGFQKRYRITWLAMAPLNDTYGICSARARAAQLHATKVSDLASRAAQLTVATPPDGQTDPNVLPGLKPTYGFTFGKTIVLLEPLTFAAVQEGKADVNVCYTTSALIANDHFVLLDDDKHLFPIYHPAPIVRDDTLRRAPAIAPTLNALAPKLTSEVSQMLQLEVVNGKSVNRAVGHWLKSVGLL
jgi:osmoprotectant transport system substrate-binding protein